MPQTTVGPGTRLIVAGVLLALILITAGATVAIRTYQGARDAEIADIADEARQSAELIERFMVGEMRTLAAIAGAPVVRAGDAGAIEEHLRALEPESLGFSGGMGWLDADRRLRIEVDTPTPSAAAEAARPDTEWVEAIWGGQERVVGAATQADDAPPLLPLAVRVRGSSDEIRGAVVGWLRLDQASTPLSPFRAAGQQGFLIDRAGRLIASDRPVTRLAEVTVDLRLPGDADGHVDDAAQVAMDVEGISGPGMLVAQAGVTRCRCRVVVERPMADTLLERREEMVAAIIALTLTAASGLAVTVVVGRRMNAERSRDQRARHLAERLQELNARLPLAQTTDAVTALVTGEVAAALKAVRASVLALPRAAGADDHPSPADHGLTPLESQALQAGDLVVLGRDGRRRDNVHAAALPMVVGRRTLGLLELRWSSPTPLPDGDADYLRSVARQGAVALERAARQMNDKLQRARAEALQRALGAVARASTRAEVLHAVSTECIPALDGIAGGVLPIDVVSRLDDEAFELQGVEDLAGTASARTPGDDDEDEPWAVPDVDPRLWPLAQRAVDGHVGLLVDLDALREEDPDAAGALVRAGAGRVGVWPIDGGAAAHGVLVVLLPHTDDERDETRTRLAALATQLGRALDRAERSDADRQIARTLQRSLLGPDLPTIGPVTLQTFYRAASSSMEVGGDWYDAVVVDDDDLRVMIGDLVGHGLVAAAAMGRLRSAARALASNSRPGRLVDLLDGVAAADRDCFMSTVVAVRVQPGRGRLTCCVAGHPPPVLIDPRTGPRLLSASAGPPLGLGGAQRPAVQEVGIEPGSALLLYTDGLVERRDEVLDAGLQRLLAAIRDLGPSHDPGWLDALVAAVSGADNDDDTACVLLGVRSVNE